MMLGCAALLAAVRPGRAAAEQLVGGRVIPDPPSQILRDVPDTPIEKIPNFRRLMRGVVRELGDVAHKRGLQVLVRNAPEMLVKDRLEALWEEKREPGQPHTPQGSLFEDYLAAVDGVMIDGLICGYGGFGQPTPNDQSARFWELAGQMKKAGKSVFTVDYSKDKAMAALVRKRARQAGFVPYLDTGGDETLKQVPSGRAWDERSEHIDHVSEARNWLPCFGGEAFHSRQAWIDRLAATNYDVLVLDPFRNGEALSKADIDALKVKVMGTRRLVLAVLPVGIANADRWYWKPDWRAGNPSYLLGPLEEDPKAWLTTYWAGEWEKLLGTYFNGLADLGVDGFLLDSVDAYTLFEDRYPID
ncbi:hypothetical protein GALL_154910 [mine drainage metagenome]|uniref:Uncharacterized protein n=1 Tax=mine drainage metagenome TaxID=410659 RepID=A0A1J5SQJ1_9ZZZZ